MSNIQNINQDNLYDVVVIGGGPAGLTAAIYLARARYRVLVLEKEQFGGQITITHEVVNYPGLGKISGKELTETMRRQAETFGAEFLMAEAESLKMDDIVKTVHTSRGDFQCLGVLLATGAHPRTIGFKGEEEHKGRGVAYCATCDGEFFTGKEVYVVGGGFAAAEESVFLTKFARHVTILVRDDNFTCAMAVAEPAKKHEKITVIYNTVVEEVNGENGLNYIRYKNTKTGDVTEYQAEDGDNFGVFVFTDSSQKTTIDGLYAAGDVCIKPLRQVVTATGDGAISATELEKYVAEMQRKTGLHPKPPVTRMTDYPNAPKTAEASDDSDDIFTAEMKAQLEGVFSKMERKLILKLYLDNRPVSLELENYITNLADLTDKLTVMVADKNDQSNLAPCVRVFSEDGIDSGIAFHGVPGGHEFTSFVLGLYNAAGPGQTIDEDTLKEVEEIQKRTDMKILVSLSCTMCPDLVIACQRIATKNKNIKAEVYDLQHFEELKKKYNVMSVPCLVINDEHVSFGKKNINQIIDIVKQV